MRTRARCSLVLSIALGLLALGAAARADTVRLKTGETIKGKIEDRGAYVIVHVKLGDVRIERAQIASIEIDGASPIVAEDVDVVVLLSGEEFAGKVTLEDDGRRVHLTRPFAPASPTATADAGGGGADFEAHQVRTILWSQKNATDAAKGAGAIPQSVERLLQSLHQKDPALREQARRQLQDLGVFALPYLERRPADPDPETQLTVLRVLAIARIKSYVTPRLAAGVTDLAARLADPDAAKRLQALQEAAAAAPGDCAGLFVHIARSDDAGSVRAFALAQLASGGRVQELSDLLNAREGSLRLAAAVALGDNGVLVGVPVVIEALKHDEESIRKIAIQRLEAWLGQTLAFFPGDEPEKRAAAVARWEEFWALRGKKIVEDSLRATVRGDDVTDEDRQAALAEWVKAQKIWDQVTALEPPLAPADRKMELEKVRFYLSKALERWPQFVNGHLALGVLLYTELGDPEGARRELEMLRDRYREGTAPQQRLLVHYHLGRVSHVQKRWGEADSSFRQAHAIDAKDVDTLEEMGLLAYDRGMNDEGLDTAGKRASFEDAVKALGTAIAAVDAHDLEVRDSGRSADAVGEDSPFKRGGFVTSLDQQKASLARRAANLRFERGRALAFLDRRDDAYRDFLAAAELVPDNADYLRAVKQWKPGDAVPEKQTGPSFRPQDVPEQPPAQPLPPPAKDDN